MYAYLSFALLGVVLSCFCQAREEKGEIVLLSDFKERQEQEDAAALVAAEDIQKRVTLAGGDTGGVLVASLSWSSADDLDLHVRLPTGEEISYSRREASGGELDVDMCVRGRSHGTAAVCAEHPVENVVFRQVAPAGRYLVYVQNFAFHANVRSKEVQVADVLAGRKTSKRDQEERRGNNRTVAFKVLVKVHDRYRLFSGLCTPRGKVREESTTRVFEFDYNPDGESEEQQVVSHLEAVPNPACTLRGRPLLEGGPSKHMQASGRPPPEAQPPAGLQKKFKSGSSKRKSHGKRQTARDKAQMQALEAIRRASRDTLLAKPAKTLQELLRDVGATCRGCIDKVEIVQRLMDAAGVNDHAAAEEL